MNEIFQFFENPVYELRSGVHLPSRNSRTDFYGTESIINLGPKMWNGLKDCSVLSNLKSNTGHQIIVLVEFAKSSSTQLVL